MKWYASSPGRTFEDEEGLVVYFSKGSGSTHLINEVAAFILDSLANAPASTEDLLHQMAAEVDDVPEHELNSLLQELLTELQASELVEAA